MIIFDEQQTLDKLIKDKCSIARFGDGELRLCLNRKQMYECPSRELSRKLKMILRKDVPGLITGTPRFSAGSKAKESEFWSNYCRPQYRKLYNKEKPYYSAFITRPDMVPGIDNQEYWDKMKMIWDGKPIVLLQGKGRQFEYAPNLLSNADKVSIIYGPRKKAFVWKYTLLKQVLIHPKETIIILSLGPTATVLAHDLTLEGYQALDLGQAGMFYSGLHPKASNYNGEFYDTDK